MAEQEETDIERINRLLGPYKHLNFVDRIYNKDKYPTHDLGNGNYATHKMSYSTDEDGAIMYPTVVQAMAGQGAPLIDLGSEAGYQHAKATGNYIPLSEADAAWLSSNYKKLWGR